MPSGKTNSNTSTSYSVFAEVDSLVSKPVLGSDGAASWQDFQKSKKGTQSSAGGGSVAPHLPVKKVDKLNTGFQSIADERSNEEKIRREAGDASLGSGYTTFKRKLDVGEREEAKRRKMIEERIRPDNVKYFIAAETFEGWKEDYVFTTKSRGTGYYWDGMDSLKKMLNNGQELSTTATIEPLADTENPTDNSAVKKKKKKKSKKKKKDKASALHSNIHNNESSATNNPMEQIQNALRRRNEILSRPSHAVLGMSTSNQASLTEAETAALTGKSLIGLSSSSSSATTTTTATTNGVILNEQLASHGWETATDPNSGKTYYFSRSTGERKWENPLANLNSKNTNNDESKKNLEELLPDGWKQATDPSSGKEYFYHAATKKTSWSRPTC